MEERSFYIMIFMSYDTFKDKIFLEVWLAFDLMHFGNETNDGHLNPLKTHLCEPVISFFGICVTEYVWTLLFLT